jgi:predicted phage terminase large subunit-like protein
VKDLCSKSMKAFMAIFLPKVVYAETPPFHDEVQADLQNQDIKRLSIIAPRGHAKSTTAAICYPLWKICNSSADNDYFAIIISESQAQSINFLTVIKNNLAGNLLLRSYYGDLVGDKWTEDEIVTKNNCRVVAKGTGQKVRGMIYGTDSVVRPHDIIMDDFESEVNSATPELIAKNIQWITKAVEPSLADDGRLITIGTIINEGAYLNRTKADPAFKTHYYQAIVGADGADLTVGHPLWPERFSMKKLLGIQASYIARGTPDAFWQEYMNVAVALDDQTFNPEWNKIEDGDYGWNQQFQSGYVKRGNIFVPINVGVGVDLAISVSVTSDWSVIAAVGTDYNLNKYLLEYKRIKTNSLKVLLDGIFEIAEKYHANTVNVETVQFQQVIANELRQQMIEKDSMFGIVETKPRTSKDSRIKSLQPHFSAGRFYQRSDMKEFRNELFAFPNAAHDDILDATYYGNMVSHPSEIESFGLVSVHQETELPSEFFEGKSWIAL